MSNDSEKHPISTIYFRIVLHTYHKDKCGIQPSLVNLLAFRTMRRCRYLYLDRFYNLAWQGIVSKQLKVSSHVWFHLWRNWNLQWTTTGMGDQQNDRQEVISAEAEKLLDFIGSYHSDEHYFEWYVENIERPWIGRNTFKHDFDIGENNNSVWVVNDGIEGINNAVISYYFLNKKYAESLIKCSYYLIWQYDTSCLI